MDFTSCPERRHADSDQIPLRKFSKAASLESLGEWLHSQKTGSFRASPS